RHRGTIGGSVAHGDPASDLPAVVLALGGTMVVRGPRGERTIAASECFEGFLQTTIEPEELLVEFRLPKVTGGWSFQKLNRRAQDWAMVGAAVATTAAGTGVALVNMGATPLRARAVEGAVASGASPAEAASVADDGTEPASDINASAQYRRHLSRVL